MNKIEYKIRFFSQWHCSSGLAAGMDMDLLVIKDENGLPFIPGKTMKGLFREAVEDLLAYKGQTDTEVLRKIFGATEKQTLPTGEQSPVAYSGSSFFSDATLSAELKDVLLKKKELSGHFYRKNTFISIDQDGIARDGHLRQVETTIPCELYGYITDLSTLDIRPEEMFAYIKRIGLNRNRGLGRCHIEQIRSEGTK